jgi:hypothetical protein
MATRPTVSKRRPSKSGPSTFPTANGRRKYGTVLASIP